jgi:hypothetical protein
MGALENALILNGGDASNKNAPKKYVIKELFGNLSFE